MLSLYAKQKLMNNLQFPLNFQFKITTFSNDFEVTDASNKTISYVRQKMFKFIDEIDVYNNQNKSELIYKIRANKWIDFSAAYSFTNKDGKHLGKVARKGWVSLWKAKYDVFDANDQHKYVIRERNAWVKFFDNAVGEIPVVGFFTGYILNPKFDVKDLSGNVMMTLTKKPSFFGRKFEVNKAGLKEMPEELLVLSLKMMVLLERRKG